MSDDTCASKELPMPLSLEQVQQRFESWRRRRKKRTRIPSNLWQAAVSLSEEYSINYLSKALRVNYTALKKQVIKFQNREPDTSGTFSSPFIELPVPAAPLTESTIEMIKSDGSVMRIQVKGVTALDWVDLGKAFWGTDS
jgi:hypothetical protein